jgi:hypothetical protein
MTISDPKPTATARPAPTFDWTPKTATAWTTTTAADQPLPWDNNQPNPPGTAPDQSDIFYTNTNVELSFTATVRLDPGDYIVEYIWDFGDGTKGYGPTAKHTYIQTTETMRVSLCVLDNHRRKVCVGRQILLLPGEPLSVGEGVTLIP